MKIFKYIVLILSVFFLAISSFDELYKWAGKNAIIPNDYRYGDLYRLSLLPFLKEKQQFCNDYYKETESKHNTHLYILGDSFLENDKIITKKFPVQKYSYLRWGTDYQLQLDTSIHNILILESVERSIKMHFVKESHEIEIRKIKKNADRKNNFSVLNILKTLNKKNINISQKTEERILHTTFNFDFALFFREIKANFDYKVFDRKAPNYYVSKNQNEIYYYEEADKNCPFSSFYEVSDSEIEGFVTIINSYHDYYVSKGFDDIYLSLIPNKVSILEPNFGKYNHVIERIQSHPKLKVKFIDTFGAFNKSPKNTYSKSDTHWNCNGSNIWHTIVNETFNQRFGN